MSDSSSDPIRKKQDRRAANISPPSFHRHTPQEEGLWNLDEDWDVENNPPPQALGDEKHRESAFATVESPAPPQEITNAPHPAPVEELVTRVEPSYSRRRLARNKPRSGEDEVADGAGDEVPESSILSSTMETPDSSESSARRKAPMGIGLTEDEVWADFSSDDKLIQNNNFEPSRLEQKEQPPENHVAESLPPVEPEPNTIKQFLKQEDVTAGEKENDAPNAETPPVVATTTTDLFDDSSSEKSRSDSLPPQIRQPFSLPFPVLSRLELVASLIFIACLLVGGLWALKVFRSEVQAQPNPYLQPDLPSSGKWATVMSADTFWRSPVTEGADADPVRQDIIRIPVIRLKLGSCTSPRGAIRVIFYNDKGLIAGDTVTHRFENQQFSQNGSSERTFSATTGFTNFGDQEAYRAHLVKPWTVRVYEGPDENAASSEYRLLFTAPISTYIQ